jgi:hypothetical protein
MHSFLLYKVDYDSSVALSQTCKFYYDIISTEGFWMDKLLNHDHSIPKNGYRWREQTVLNAQNDKIDTTGINNELLSHITVDDINNVNPQNDYWWEEHSNNFSNASDNGSTEQSFSEKSFSEDYVSDNDATEAPFSEKYLSEDFLSNASDSDSIEAPFCENKLSEDFLRNASNIDSIEAPFCEKYLTDNDSMEISFCKKASNENSFNNTSNNDFRDKSFSEDSFNNASNNDFRHRSFANCKTSFDKLSREESCHVSLINAVRDYEPLGESVDKYHNSVTNGSWANCANRESEYISTNWIKTIWFTSSDINLMVKHGYYFYLREINKIDKTSLVVHLEDAIIHEQPVIVRFILDTIKDTCVSNTFVKTIARMLSLCPNSDETKIYLIMSVLLKKVIIDETVILVLALFNNTGLLIAYLSKYDIEKTRMLISRLCESKSLFTFLPGLATYRNTSELIFKLLKYSPHGVLSKSTHHLLDLIILSLSKYQLLSLFYYGAYKHLLPTVKNLCLEHQITLFEDGL